MLRKRGTLLEVIRLIFTCTAAGLWIPLEGTTGAPETPGDWEVREGKEGGREQEGCGGGINVLQVLVDLRWHQFLQSIQ